MGIGQVTRPAAGLNRFLDLLTGGIGPDQLNTEIRPMIDIMSFIGFESMRVADANVTWPLANATASATITPAQGKLWIVRSVQGHCIVPAMNQSFMMALQITGLPHAFGDTGLGIHYIAGSSGAGRYASSGTATSDQIFITPPWIPSVPVIIRNGMFLSNVGHGVGGALAADLTIGISALVYEVDAS